jgi:hypothetical protein
MLVLTLAGHRVRVTTRFDNLPSLGLLFLDVLIGDTPCPACRLRRAPLYPGAPGHDGDEARAMMAGMVLGLRPGQAVCGSGV